VDFKLFYGNSKILVGLVILAAARYIVSMGNVTYHL